jgi:predicted amidohydrolase
MKVASVQTDPKLGDLRRNLETILRGIREARADLVVFPECALSGYGFDSRRDGVRAAEPLPGPASTAIQAACRESGSRVVFGLLERAGKRLFNSAALVGPRGIAGVYRKAHLPFLGVDRFTDKGDLGFPVFRTPLGRIGMLICYDGSFPEAPRALKLGGAQLICLPTNWPEAAEVSACHSPMVRAQENHVHFVTCNRVGREAGFSFRGESRICDYSGRVLAVAGRRQGTIRADLDLRAADRNRVVYSKGRYELDRIGHRRPELYGALTDRRFGYRP